MMVNDDVVDDDDDGDDDDDDLSEMTTSFLFPPPSAFVGSCLGSLVFSPAPEEEKDDDRDGNAFNCVFFFWVIFGTLISPSRASRRPRSSSTSSFNWVLSWRLCSRLTFICIMMMMMLFDH